MKLLDWHRYSEVFVTEGEGLKSDTIRVQVIVSFISDKSKNIAVEQLFHKDTSITEIAKAVVMMRETLEDHILRKCAESEL